MTTDRVVIPLTDYGMEGEVILAYPGFKKAQIAQAKSMGMTVKYQGDEKQVDFESAYFAAFEKLSFYIESAPAEINGYESLLDFLDTVDKSCAGAAEDLVDKMVTAMGEIEEGHKSPFVKSPGAVTGRSG